MRKEKIIKELQNEKCRSAWSKGVNEYALELLETLEGDEITKETLLNGAENWKQYSWGGCSLIYDSDICERLCNNTEKKITKNGERRPNSKEEWLDVQARALFQACNRILYIKKTIIK